MAVANRYRRILEVLILKALILNVLLCHEFPSARAVSYTGACSSRASSLAGGW